MSTQAEQVVEEMLAYRCPRYAQLPEIPLYRDQVLDALERYTAPFFSGQGEPLLTAAMINNYVKLQLIAPPVMVIQSRSYPLEQAYDYFCTELEKALQATFGTRDFSLPSSARKTTPESELVRSLALCFANKMFTLKFIRLYPGEGNT